MASACAGIVVLSSAAAMQIVLVTVVVMTCSMAAFPSVQLIPGRSGSRYCIIVVRDQRAVGAIADTRT